MCNAYVSARKHKVFNIYRIKTAVGYSERRRAAVVGGGVAVMVKAERRVIIYAPAAVGDNIVKFSACLHLVLGQKDVYKRQKQHRDSKVF